jgi:four helix bundle protein
MCNKPYDLKLRTKVFAIEILKFVDTLPNKRSTNIIANQIGRSGTSVAANFRASQRVKSVKDFINNLKISEEECDETLFWSEVLNEGSFYKSAKSEELIREANELLAIIVKSIQTTRQNSNK